MNFQQILYSLTSVLYGLFADLAKAYGPDYEKIQETAEEWLEEHKKRLSDTTIAKLEGRLNDEEFINLAKDSLSILQSQALATLVAGEAAVQVAINETIEKLKVVVGILIPGANISNGDGGQVPSSPEKGPGQSSGDAIGASFDEPSTQAPPAENTEK